MTGPGPSAEALPSAPPSLTAASTSVCSRGRPRASNSCSSTGRTTPPRPAWSGSIRRRTAPTTTGTSSCRVCGRDRSTAIGSRGRRTPRGLRFDPAKVLLDPYGRGVVVPKNYGREAARREGDNAATAMKSVVVDPGAYDWEGDAPAEPALRTHDHLRDARPRVHPPPELRRRREDPRHVRRPDREDPLSPATRHHGRGTAAGVPVRRPGLPARARSTTGAMRRSRSSRRTRPTARVRTRSAR